MNLTTNILRHPKLTLTIAALLALMALCRAGDTNTVTNAPAKAEPAKHEPIKLLSPEALRPQWRTVYILPASVGVHVPAVRVGTNILPNVLLVVCEQSDIARLQKLGYAAGQADIEIIQPAK